MNNEVVPNAVVVKKEQEPKPLAPKVRKVSKPKSAAKKPAAKKVRKAAKKPVRPAKQKAAKRRPVPYEKIAKMWALKKTIAEIAKAIGRVGKSDDPYHSLRVILTKMHKGEKDKSGKVMKLPHRVSKKTLRLAAKAGKKASA
jgi:hypothetical protein